jgi:hypothetical protein
MLVVPRQQLLAWADGILLDRDAKGNVIAPEELLCKEAQRRLELGEAVGLTISGEIVSTMQLDIKVGKYVEKRYIQKGRGR